MDPHAGISEGLIRFLAEYHLTDWVLLALVGLVWRLFKTNLNTFRDAYELRLKNLEVDMASAKEGVSRVGTVISLALKEHTTEEKEFWKEMRDEMKGFREIVSEFGERISTLEGTLRQNGHH